MKQGRMKSLLEDLEKRKRISVTEFLSYIAVNYGIRRSTGQEYLRDWIDGGYITIEKGIIFFLKKNEED